MVLDTYPLSNMSDIFQRLPSNILESFQPVLDSTVTRNNSEKNILCSYVLRKREKNSD